MPQVHETIAINAPAEEVWAVAGDPGRIAEWLPAVASSELVGEERRCTLEDGGRLEERILDHSDRERAYVYEITDGPMPVSSYRSRLGVQGHDDHAHVDWFAEFEVEDPGQASQLAATMSEIYREGLEALREQVEARAG